MLRRLPGSKVLVLPDSLAPGLIARAASSFGRAKNLRHPPKDAGTSRFQAKTSPAIIEKLKQQVTIKRSPNGRGRPDPTADIFNSTVMRIRQALQCNNIDAVWEYWQYLDQNKLLRFLGPSQLEMISGLIARSFCSSHDLTKSWSTMERRAVEEIALAAAAARATDALNACMMVHIRRNDSEATLDLYKRFLKLVGKKEGWVDVESNDSREEGDHAGYDALASASPSSTDTIPHDPGRTTLLLAAITAHAMRDSFHDALQACLDTTIRLQYYATRGFLKQLCRDPNLQQKVETYVNRLRIARMVARPPDLSRRVTHLSNSHAIKPLEKLYDAVINGLAEPDAYLAAHPASIAPHKSIALTEVGWTSFLVAFLKCRRKDLAKKMWDDMNGFGVRPGVSTWTALIDACASTAAVDEAIAGWNMMVAQGVQPGPLTYRALISTFFNARRPKEAMEKFQAFQKGLSQGHLPAQILPVYNTALHGLLVNARLEEANALFQKMHENGPSPDVVSYNTFLRYFGRLGDFKMLASLVSKMSSRELVGDVFSFSTILSALLKIGREDAPDMMLSLMQKQGIEPNVATYSAIIDQQLREQSEQSLRAAMHILQKMELDPKAQPNEVTYTSFIAGIYRGNWLPPRMAEEWRENIVDRMKKRGVSPNRVTYHLLLKACLEYPEPEGLRNAMAYYREMIKQKVPMVHITWYILLGGLLQRGEWVVAEEVVTDMFKSGFQPEGGLLELVSKIRKR